MRIVTLFFAFLSTAWCFDLSSIDTDNAYWQSTSTGQADITIEIKFSVSGLFERQESFPYYYAGTIFDVLPDGTRIRSSFRGEKKTIPYFETNGNRGWIYIRKISAEGAYVRCVVRESPDNGKILYEREFLIPWSSKTFSLQTDTERFEAEIRIATKNTK